MGKLKPSLSAVWLLHCTASPQLFDKVPSVNTQYTTKGTEQHLRAAYEVKKAFGLPQLDIEFKCDSPEDAIEYAKQCVELTTSLMTDSGDYDAQRIYVEEKLSMSPMLPSDNHGVVDFAAYTHKNLIVVDYKSGYLPISAEGNPQLYLYALAILARIEPEGFLPDRIYVAISQPSKDNLSIEALSREQLFAWYERYRLNIERSANGTGDFVPGDHCVKCPARAICRAYLLYRLSKGDDENADTED